MVLTREREREGCATIGIRETFVSGRIVEFMFRLELYVNVGISYVYKLHTIFSSVVFENFV